MYYYSKKSKSGILHFSGCFHLERIAGENRGTITSLEEAKRMDFRLCRCCSPLAVHYRKEIDPQLRCRHTGKALVLFGDFSVEVATPLSRWKLIPTDTGGICLYHQNTLHPDDNDGAVPGYHPQQECRSSIRAYLRYIDKHDDYRRLNPVSPQNPPRKGTRAYKNYVKKQKEKKRQQSIRNVLALIDSLHEGKTDAGMMQM